MSKQSNSHIKVLHFFKTYYPDSFGGVEQVIYQLAEGGPAFGISAEVLSLSNRGSFRNVPLGRHITHGSKLDLYLASTGFSISAFKDFQDLAVHADVVHYHFPWPFMDLVHFATRVRRPSVLTYHSDIVKQKFLLQAYKPLMYQFLKSVDCIVATSPNYLATSSILSHFKDKVSVVPIGLDRYMYPPAQKERLEKWKNKLGGPFFLFVGAIRYYKGLHILLEAMEGIDLPLVIVGAGPIEVELKEQAKKSNLRNVHFLGALPDDDKYALLELCYSVVFPSHLRSEAFGISLLEGAMYGKPMISSEIGTGTTYININKETGLVVPPSNALSLRQALLTLWSDPSLARQYGLQAQQRYESLFTADKMLSKYNSIYRDVLSGN